MFDEHIPDEIDTNVEHFSFLYRTTYNDAVRFLKSRFPGCDAEAIASDTFEICWRHTQEGRAISRKWIFGILRNKIGDHLRSTRRHAPYSSLEELCLEASSPDEKILIRHLVNSEIKHLPQTHAIVLYLTYIKDYSSSTAAATLGISSSAYRMRLSRARKELLRQLSKIDPEHLLY